MRYYLTPITVVIFFFLNVGKDVDNCSWECEMVQPLWTTIWQLLKN